MPHSGLEQVFNETRQSWCTFTLFSMGIETTENGTHTHTHARTRQRVDVTVLRDQGVHTYTEIM